MAAVIDQQQGMPHAHHLKHGDEGGGEIAGNGRDGDDKEGVDAGGDKRLDIAWLRWPLAFQPPVCAKVECHKRDNGQDIEQQKRIGHTAVQVVDTGKVGPVERIDRETLIGEVGRQYVGAEIPVGMAQCPETQCHTGHRDAHCHPLAPPLAYLLVEFRPDGKETVVEYQRQREKQHQDESGIDDRHAGEFLEIGECP